MCAFPSSNDNQFQKIFSIQFLRTKKREFPCQSYEIFHTKGFFYKHGLKNLHSSYGKSDKLGHTFGFKKRSFGVYSMNTIYLSHSTQVVDGTVFKKNSLHEYPLRGWEAIQNKYRFVQRFLAKTYCLFHNSLPLFNVCLQIWT